MKSNPPFLSCRHLWFEHSTLARTKEPLFTDFVFEMAQGETVVIMGPSGCGKTTLLRLLAGLERPLRGTICLEGTSIERPGQGVIYVWQRPELFPWLSVLDNIRMVPRAKNQEFVLLLIEKLRLGEHIAKYPRELSGGIAQRVALARAFAQKPRVLLLDEPFAALDTPLKEQLYLDFLNLKRELSLSVVLVTHDEVEAATLASRILFLKGRPVTVAEELNIDNLREQRCVEQGVRSAAFELASQVAAAASLGASYHEA